MAISGHNQSEKIRRCQDYIRALEEERTKIQAFQRELPLCLELVTQEIESCKQRLSGTNECNLRSEEFEGLEQTSSRVPVLEEFVRIPTVIKRASNSDSGCEEHDFKKPKIDDVSVTDKDRENGCRNDNNSARSDWLRSVQLWNQPSKEDDSTKTVGLKRDGSGGAFHPFKKEKNADIVTENKNEEQDKSSRKSRRCWSPQLHERFLQALHELGGSHVATPKQIRDLMKVEGLTNDEVKSHLQKYRLHERRPITSSQNITAVSTQTPQFVVVTGGLWMPTATTTASNGIYAPVASLPLPFRETPDSLTRRQHGNNKTSDSNIRGSDSPVTSSSTNASTASAY